jgi:VanZ family protein
MKRFFPSPLSSPSAMPTGAIEIRAVAMLYILLIVHLSLFPYTDWRDLGVGAFDYLTAPWIPPQQTILWRDVFINVTGYIPLGVLLTLGLFPTVGGFAGVLLATVAIVALSGLLEAVQTFLPLRVPSKLDFLTNSVGGLVGSVFAHALTQPLVNSGLWPGLRRQWLESKTLLGVTTIILWCFALLCPQAVPFVLGPWLGDVWMVATTHLGLIDLQNELAFRLLTWESMSVRAPTGFFLLGAWSLGLAHTRRSSPRLRLLLVLMLLTLLAGWIGPQLLPWIQGEPLKGLTFWEYRQRLAIVIASALALGLALSNWPPYVMGRIATVSIALGWLGTLLLPGFSAPVKLAANDPIEQVIEHIQAAAAWVATLWPLLALYVAVRCGQHSVIPKNQV